MDKFADFTHGLEAPAIDAFEVMPNDSADLLKVTRAVHVGTGGSVRVTMLSGAIVTFSGLGPGALLPIRVSRVHATGTMASDLVALV